MQVYHFKVSLFGYHEQPVNQLHRVIAISENSTFAELHEAIFDAFDREDPHLYTFFLTKKDSKNMREIMNAPSITNPYSFAEGDFYTDIKPKNAATTTIKNAKLKLKDVLHYWFDFGDDWWHRLRLDRITTDNSTIQPYVKVTKKVGKSPAQYPDYNDDEDYENNFGDSDESGLDNLKLDPKRLDQLGLCVEDVKAFGQAMQEHSPKSLQQLVERYGMESAIDLIKMTGLAHASKLEGMLNNLPIFVFLQSLDNPSLTLAKERNLLDTLIQRLQNRLANTEEKLAATATASKVPDTKVPATKKTTAKKTTAKKSASKKPAAKQKGK